MSEKKTFWRVWLEDSDGYEMFTDDLNDLGKEIGFEEGTHAVFHISRVEMTQEDFDALPDFESF